MLEINDCTAGYDGVPVLQGVSLSVSQGKTGCIIGPSGCGKTTLLTLAAGLKRADAGSIRLDGQPITPGDARVGLILQQYGLFPWFTVGENVAIGLRIRHMAAEARRRIISRELSRLGLAELAARYPGELSGGQQQRVAIARSMALAPRLLLMDEPFSALDALSRESLQEILLSMLVDQTIIALLVTHSIEEAVYLGGTIWLMAGSPAHIEATFDNPGQGTPGYRVQPAFFRLCSEIRHRMETCRAI